MITIILVILFGIFTTINSYISSCGNSSTCKCSFTSLDALNMDYDDNMGIEMIVDFSEWSRLEVVCNGTHKLEDFKHTSKLPGKTINSLSIISCVLSKKTSLKEFVQKIGIVESNTLSYQYFKTINTLLTREHLKGISNVKELILSHNSLHNITSEFFSEFPELEKLDLSHNNFSILLDIFNKTQNLKHLDLNNNNIHSISSTVFNILENLEHLDFGYNNLRYIHGSAFNKLVSLKSFSLKGNEMNDLSWDLLSQLKNLESIDISYNSFVNVPQRLFRKNKNLRKIVFDNNYVNLVTLPDSLLTNLVKLEEISLNNDGLLFIPDSIFTDLSSLKYISLGYNNLSNLQQYIFQGLKNLEVLKLNNNEMQTIPRGTFLDLERLKILDLSMNNINHIQRGLFENLKSLTELNMENNRLKSIQQEILKPLKELSIAKFSNNQLDFINTTNDWSPFYSNTYLRELHLSNNSIQNFFVDWSTIFNLTFLNLSHNDINTISGKHLHFRFQSNQIMVDLRYNKLSNILLDGIEFAAIDQTKKRDVKVLIDHNPLLCDCHLNDLISYFQNEMRTSVYNYINIVAENLRCVYTDGTMGLTIKELNSTTFICPEHEYFNIEERCQLSCTCNVRPKDKTRILDCSNKEMSFFEIDEKKMYHVVNYSLILNLTGNALTTMPSMVHLHSIELTHLLLSNNLISEITIDKLPPSIKVLQMHNNTVSRIKFSVLTGLNPVYLDDLTLSGNPFICDCDVEDLYDFVKTYRSKFKDLDKLTCENMNIPMYKLRFESFCTPVVGLKGNNGLNER